MKFKHVADSFESLEKISSRLEITRILADLLAQATPHEAAIIVNLSLGLLRPPYQGTQFNFAQKSLIDVVAQVTKQDEKDIKLHLKQLGDLGLVLMHYGHWQPQKELTVTQVYQALSELEKISGIGSQEEKTIKVVALLELVDQLSAKFIIRIILGTLRLGFSDMTILVQLAGVQLLLDV